MARGLKPTATITASLRDAGTTEVERRALSRAAYPPGSDLQLQLLHRAAVTAQSLRERGLETVRGIADNILVYEDKASREGNPPFQRPSGQYAWGRQVEVFGKLVDA